jgi:RNA polymerase sigma factor (sigma-70 family)
MLSIENESSMELNDTELVSQSVSGSREAFGRIVEQYQSLICSITYSATGSVCQSEDFAQETFVIAWKELPRLREPKKLRSWLCSIARSVISNASRRQRREPTHTAEPMDTAGETATTEPIPSERAINREEETILWRSLERIPDIYREPLVLFYREQKSVADVAEKLELTEDAVKQRLSRGRKLLTEEVAAFVEGTLARTNPGKVFTLGVLAALPVFATSAKAATIGATAVKGSAAAKAAASLGIFSAVFAPVIGILAGVVGTRINMNTAESPRERQFKIKMAWIAWSLILTFNLSLFGGMALVGPYWTTHPVLLTWAIVSVSVGYGLMFVWLVCWAINRQRRIGLEEAAESRGRPVHTGSRPIGLSYEYRSRWTLFGWPLIHIRLGGEPCERTPVKGWIAIGNVAYGILFAIGGVAVGAVSIGGIAAGGVAIGGCALGLLTCGGLALGFFAVGAVALGYMVCGGAAVAWLASCGGAAVAHYFALGTFALAQHANDEIAQAFVRNSALFSHGYLFSNLSMLFIALSMLPRLIYWRKQSRQQQAGC